MINRQQYTSMLLLGRQEYTSVWFARATRVFVIHNVVLGHPNLERPRTKFDKGGRQSLKAMKQNLGGRAANPRGP